MTAGAPLICVGVPVWNGADIVGETLESVLRQRDVQLAVFISVDGADKLSAEACRPFLSDPRVRLAIQPERLGWVRNSAAVLAAGGAVAAQYGCVQPHDDLMKDGYLAALVEVAERSPAAAVVYSDIETLGKPERIIVQPAVTGQPLARQLDILAHHFDAVAWRGLTRLSALARAAPLGRAAYGDFGADTVWMARLARAGELIRIPEPLYLKRYRAKSAHAQWGSWPRGAKLRAWTEHCLAMLDEALPVAAGPHQRRELVAAARDRLLQRVRPLAFHRDMSTMTGEERERMLGTFDAAVEP
jgi:GT2 family glycosyltransferase